MAAVSKGERTKVKEMKRILNTNVTKDVSHRCVKIDFNVTVHTVDQFSRLFLVFF